MMQKVLVVVGPTGVGKTKLSIELAQKYNAEIISGDAYQCYKELTIGSAKISPEEMQGIPHYLVDTIAYKEVYNVKHFQQKARLYIDDIARRGKLAMVVGGTGLYIKSLLYDYIFHDEEIDVRYATYLETQTNEELYKLLLEVDEKTAQTLHLNNRQRIKRALMMEHMGHKKSEILAKQEHKLLYDVYIVGLTMERSHLYERIDERVLKMIEQGLEKEVMGLVNTIDDFALQSLQGIGYKEWKNYYLGEKSKADTIALIQKNTRNFAKRQYTWFHNQMDIHWFDVESKDYKKRLLIEIENWIKEA